MRRDLSSLAAIPSSPRLASSPGVVDLWYFPYEQVADLDPLWSAYLELLTADERKRGERYLMERDRRQFLATRALARTVLSHYAAVAAADWRFALGERGKPHIAGPPPVPPLYFNLANTAGLVVCAVSLVHETLGVDVERLDRRNDLLALADRYFAPAEATALRVLPSADRPRRFFDYWTLKESYIKARGQGLAIPLDSFAFELTGGEVAVRFEATRGENAADWQFVLLDFPPRYALAVGVNTLGVPLQLRARPYVPLRD